MRLGISALVSNLSEALEICKANKEINHIEIGIDNISDCKELKKYETSIKNLGLSVGIHLPMELNACEDILFIKEKWIEYIVKLNKEISYLNACYFNMHLGYVMTNRFTNNKKKYLDNILNFFDKLLSNNNSLPMTIENTYTKGGDFSNVGSDVEVFEYILNHNEDIKFCFDSGHNLINRSDYFSLENKTQVIHLSDNNGIEDEHKGLLEAKLSKEELNKILSMQKAEFLILEMKFEYIEQSLDIIKRNFLK